jgi:hypothetical protein
MAKHPSKRQFEISVARSDGMNHTWTFYIHEIRVGRLHETLEFVLLALMFRRRVQQIDGQRLDGFCEDFAQIKRIFSIPFLTSFLGVA